MVDVFGKVCIATDHKQLFNRLISLRVATNVLLRVLDATFYKQEVFINVPCSYTAHCKINEWSYSL
jgi:hypothetical protein